jgi:prepilin-type N-terminal cleavage/methylation domain-containing protein
VPRPGVSLLEITIVLVVMAILMTVAYPALRPSEAERLRSAADLLAADLRLAQSLAVRDGTNFTLTLTAEGWKIEHSGTGPAPILPTPALGGTGAGYEVKVRMLVGRAVASAGRLADSGAATTSVTFTSTGGTTATQSVVLWLTTGSGSETRSAPVAISHVSGRAAVGEMRAGSAPAIGQSTPLAGLGITTL